jgi:hypothetical protein
VHFFGVQRAGVRRPPLTLGARIEHLVIVTIILVGVASLVALNSWASWRIGRDDLMSKTQRTAQTIFIWVLPLVGALLMLYFHHRQLEPSSRGSHGPSGIGDDFGYSGSNVRTLRHAIETHDNPSGGASDNSAEP